MTGSEETRLPTLDTVLGVLGLIFGALAGMEGLGGLLGMIFGGLIGLVIGVLIARTFIGGVIGWLLGSAIDPDIAGAMAMIGGIIQLVIHSSRQRPPAGPPSEYPEAVRHQRESPSPNHGSFGRGPAETASAVEIELTPITTASAEVQGRQCPVCLTGLASGAEMVTCPSCETVYHHECWIAMGGCAVYGCTT